MTKLRRTTTRKYGTADKKPKGTADKNKKPRHSTGNKFAKKKDEQVRRGPKDRDKDKRERQLLRKSILDPHRPYALQLFERPQDAQQRIANCQRSLHASPRLNLPHLRQLAAKIYDTQHFDLNSNLETVKYSQEFTSHFDVATQVGTPSDFTVVTPAKKLRQKAKQGITSPLAHDDSTKETEEDKKETEVDHSAKDDATTTKEEETTEDEASTKDSKEEASDEETLPSTSLQTLFGTLDAEFNDEVQSFNELAADKEPTPRATNTSIDDSFRYEPSTFVTEPPTPAVKEEDEDEEEEKEAEEHDEEEDVQTAADTAKDASTISSKATDTSTESLDYKQLYNDLKKDLESQHLYWNERMEYLEAQAQDRMDQLEQRTMEQTAARMEQLEKRTELAQEAHESRFRNAFKSRNATFDKKIEEVTTQLGGVGI